MDFSYLAMRSSVFDDNWTLLLLLGEDLLNVFFCVHYSHNVISCLLMNTHQVSFNNLVIMFG